MLVRLGTGLLIRHDLKIILSMSAFSRSYCRTLQMIRSSSQHDINPILDGGGADSAPHECFDRSALKDSTKWGHGVSKFKL